MQQQPTPTKKKHKLPSAFTILFLLIALMAVLTWIIPAGTYKSDSAGNLISGTHVSHGCPSLPRNLGRLYGTRHGDDRQ